MEKERQERRERSGRWRLLAGAGLLAAAWALGGCTELMEPGPGGSGTEDGGKQYTLTFSPVCIDEGEATRAATTAEVVTAGKLRLLVYGATDATTGQPLADRLYDVKDGLLKPADGLPDLELSAGSYQFYALMPGDAISLSDGISASVVEHGDDPLASRTQAMVGADDAKVMLEPLKHKASRVEFVVTKADDATYATLSLPSSLTLFSQTEAPVAFQLDESGGNLVIPPAGGLDTLCFNAFTGTEQAGFRQDRLVLPRIVSDFNLSLETEIDFADGQGPQPCTVKGRVEKRLFEPGRYYHFSIRVKDLREGGDIRLVVTPWNGEGWNDGMGGPGSVTLNAGKWTAILVNDDMGG